MSYLIFRRSKDLASIKSNVDHSEERQMQETEGERSRSCHLVSVCMFRAAFLKCSQIWTENLVFSVNRSVCVSVYELSK